MKRLLFLLLFISTTIFSQQKIETKKVSSTILKHGITIHDDYKWLENTSEKAVEEWVELQNNVSDKKLTEAVKKHNFSFKIKDYNYLSTYAIPSKKGKYFYSLYRVDKNKPGVLHYSKSLNDIPTPLVDPFDIYKDANVIMSDYYPSRNSKYLAFKISPNGSDRQEIKFKDFSNKKYLDDVLTDIKFSNVAWNDDKGIFYKKNLNKEFFAKDSTYQLYYHKIGDLQSKDQLVYDTSNSKSNFTFFTKKDKLYIVETSENESTENYYYTDTNSESFEFKNFLKDENSNLKFLNIANDKFYFSDEKYPWGNVSYFDINNRTENTVLIPQVYTHLLVGTTFLEDYIICKYNNSGKFYMSIYDYTGKFIRKFEAPHSMDFQIRLFDKKSNNLFVTFYSYTISSLNYKLNITTGANSIYFNDFIVPKPSLFPFNYFETKTITYKSRDNQQIPIVIIHKKGIELNGDNPTLLRAYGGFGVVSSPNYDTGLLHFLEKGGVYAFAQVRGGGEKGQNWHKEGKGLKKINSINDFVDAAEFLIAEKYTNPNKLAINGGSHGGLVVGAAMTQRPDLFKVVVSEMGRLDMSTLEKYTTGSYHFDEYGNPNNKEEFESLISYSPYHTIKEDVNYPTCLIITSENDDRVPPFHSYKFVAKLQNRAAQKNPIYLKVNKIAGHSGNISSYEKRVKEKSEFYSFILYHLNN
ncbi:prolyl oligopeptidase family serine peptidase [Flavobacterium ardleyense]|uniref:prolyl oligopeptidase n=1 Tax=Flavobacterium ardleyense TaxID=2038737 RepID=A0ABW5Z9G4_9FLAO